MTTHTLAELLSAADAMKSQSGSERSTSPPAVTLSDNEEEHDADDDDAADDDANDEEDADEDVDEMMIQEQMRLDEERHRREEAEEEDASVASITPDDSAVTSKAASQTSSKNASRVSSAVKSAATAVANVAAAVIPRAMSSSPTNSITGGGPRSGSGATPAPTILASNSGNTYHTTNININASDGVVPSPTNASALQAFMLPMSSQAAMSPSAHHLDNPLLHSFQSHALSTVQNLASSFGHIATVLQKDQSHAAKEEENVRRKLTLLQNTVNSLAAQNKELAGMLVRASDKSTAQARELNEKVNILNNTIVVGLSAAGVSVAGGMVDVAVSSSALTRSRAASPAVGGRATPAAGGVLAVPTAAATAGGLGIDNSQYIMERLSRLEYEVAFQTKRADTAQTTLSTYLSNLQSQLKQHQHATIQLVTGSTGDGAKIARDSTLAGANGLVNQRAAMQKLYEEIVPPVYEISSTDSTDAEHAAFVPGNFALATNGSFGGGTNLGDSLSALERARKGSHGSIGGSESPRPVSLGLGAGQGHVGHGHSRAVSSLPHAGMARPLPSAYGSDAFLSAEQQSRISTALSGLSATDAAKLDAAIELAAANAVAAQNRKGPSSELMIATAASHSAQAAAKEAQEVLASINFMRENLQFTNAAASTTAAAATNAPAANLAVQSELFAESADSKNVGSTLAMKKLQDKIQHQERAIWTLDSTVQSMGNQLLDLSRSNLASKDATSSGLKNLTSDFTNILQQFSSLSRQFQAQHLVLDGRITQYASEFDRAMKHSIQALEVLERAVAKKADLSLVLDKVTRAEYVSQVRKLQTHQEDLSSRSVNKEEYRLQLNELRDVISEDGRSRLENLARLANELGKLVGDMETKATKTELLDIAKVLNSMPKVHDEMEVLKEHVSKEIEQRTTSILDITVDRKQLKRSMQRLLKSLQEEVSAATAPVNCDTCAMRTGVHSGTNCLSCAQQMKLNMKLATYAGFTAHTPAPGEQEILASRGGGFMVTSTTSSSSLPPSSTGNSVTAGLSGTGTGRRPQSKQAQLSLVQGQGQGMAQEWRTSGGSSAIRPSTGSNSARGSGFTRTTVLPAVGNSIDHFPPALSPSSSSLPSTPLAIQPTSSQSQQQLPLSVSSQVGSDGRVYTSRSSRTHRLVASQSGKSRARMEEDGELTSEREEKDASDGGARFAVATAKGSQSAKIRK